MKRQLRRSAARTGLTVMSLAIASIALGQTVQSLALSGASFEEVTNDWYVGAEADVNQAAYSQNQAIARVFIAHEGASRLMLDGTWQQQSADESSVGTVFGTVTYLPRIALPTDAIVRVQLLDLSRQDTQAESLAVLTFSTEGQQVPIEFQLAYDTAAINPSHTYGLQASIFVDDQLQFTSTTAYPVLTQGHGNQAEVQVDLVSQ